jgi:predicted transposase YbfD/YdcC
VSAWASEKGLTPAQVPTNQKPQQITANPVLLRLIDLKKASMTIDAMETQRKISQQIVDGKGNYILPLKANHKKTHATVINDVEEQINGDLSKPRHQELEYTPKKSSHGRTESRSSIQFEVPADFPDHGLWTGLTTIGLVVYVFLRGGKEHTDIRYGLSSPRLDAAFFTRYTRSHWGSVHLSLESCCHVQRGRIKDPRTTTNVEHGMAQTLHIVIAQAASRQDGPGHEAQIMRSGTAASCCKLQAPRIKRTSCAVAECILG